MRKVLITGANGLVGRPIGNLLEKFFDVYSIKREGHVSGAKVISGDLRERGGWRHKVMDINPGLVIHCAAEIPTPGNPDSLDVYRNNWQIDRNLFELVKEMGARLVYISSTAVYDDLSGAEAIHEDSPVKKKGYYSSQKLEAEEYITSEIPQSWILRINAPYGTGGRVKTVLSIFIEAALNDLPLRYHGSGSRMQDFTHTSDIAELILGIIQTDNKDFGIYNIASGQPVSMKTLAGLIVKLSGSNSAIEPSGLDDPQENQRAIFSVEKAARSLNWKPAVRLENGLLEMINNYPG